MSHDPGEVGPESEAHEPPLAPKVHKREDFAAEADTLGLNAERALAGMVSRIFGATLEQVADDIAECADIALRELAHEHLPWLNKRMFELMEQRTRARTGD